MGLLVTLVTTAPSNLCSRSFFTWAASPVSGAVVRAGVCACAGAAKSASAVNGHCERRIA